MCWQAKPGPKANPKAKLASTTPPKTTVKGGRKRPAAARPAADTQRMKRPAAAADLEAEIPADDVAVASEGGPPEDGHTPMRRPASSDALAEGLNSVCFRTIHWQSWLRV